MPEKKDITKDIEKKAADKLAAEEIEAKKTVRKAARTAKEAVENAAQSDAVVAAQIEVKKTARKAARKVKEAVETGEGDKEGGAPRKAQHHHPEPDGRCRHHG